MFMEKITEKLKELSVLKKLVLVAVDGPCASGKTTLAQKLAAQTGAQVVHADDFFLPFEMKTPERLAQAGGNIHYERFFDEVTNGVNSGRPFEYGVYNCSEGRITEKKTIIPEGIVIVEGSYSMHPETGVDWDLRIFVEAEYEVRLERILKRNGTEKLKIFKEKWIPMENAYFESYGIKDKCDIIVK